MKKCIKCDFESETNFCPNCGEKMVAKESQGLEEKDDSLQPVNEDSNQGFYYRAEPKKAEESVKPEESEGSMENKEPESPAVSEGNAKEKLSSKTWWIILWLFLFWPVGLFLMWKKKKWSKTIRIIITIVLAFLFVIGIFSSTNGNSDTDYTDNDSSYYESEEETEPETEAPTEAVFNEADYAEISYNDLARNPDTYMGKKIKGTGTVIQVIESDDEIQLRIAIGDDYDHVILVAYSPSIVDSRILEDDTVTYYGNSIGTITYESTMGGNITVPAAYLSKIVLN